MPSPSSGDEVSQRTSVRIPTLWDVHVGTIKFADRCASEQPQRAVEVGAQEFDGAIDPGFSRGGQAISVCAAADHRASAKTERFRDVGAAPNATIHQYFGLSL